MSTLLFLLLAGQGFLTSDLSGTPPLMMTPSPPPLSLSSDVIITAESALILDIDSGGILYKKNIHEKRPIASLTKLMTALVFLESGKTKENIHISKNAAEIEGSQMHLLQGESLSGENLLLGLLIQSGNDAAIAIAEHISKIEQRFVEKMNHTAQRLRLFDTHFANAHGLDDPKGFSTAHDVGFLAKKLWHNKDIPDIVKGKTITVYDTTRKHAHVITSTNQLLWSAFPLLGMKTGTTDNAGECFVGVLRVRGRDYITVILGSTDRFQDTKALWWMIDKASEEERKG